MFCYKVLLMQVITGMNRHYCTDIYSIDSLFRSVFPSGEFFSVSFFVE